MAATTTHSSDVTSVQSVLPVLMVVLNDIIGIITTFN